MLYSYAAVQYKCSASITSPVSSYPVINALSNSMVINPKALSNSCVLSRVA